MIAHVATRKKPAPAASSSTPRRKTRKPRARAESPERPVGDVALVVGPTEDQQGFRVLRKRSEDAPVELGTVRPMKEGEPIDGEVVKMRPRKNVPFVYDVKSVMDAPKRFTSDGPPQVATDEYRRGWDAIWGKRGKNQNAVLN